MTIIVNQKNFIQINNYCESERVPDKQNARSEIMEEEKSENEI